MDKKSQAKLLPISLILLIVVGITIPLFVFAGAEDWTIEGDAVYVDDEFAYIRAEPHTLTESGYVYFNITSKIFEGDVDIVFGFNTTIARPKSIELFKPHTVSWNSTNEETFRNVSSFEIIDAPCNFGFEYNTFKRNGTYYEAYMDGDVRKWTKNSSVVCFDSYTQWGDHYFLIWNEEMSEVEDYVDKTSTMTHSDNHPKGLDWWFVKNINITAGKNYMFRGYVNVPVSGKGKYWFAIKPSSLTIQEAISQDKFYALDPWWEITKADHLDENKTFVSDIYNEVYNLDDVWSETIPDNHYVRTTFEVELDNTNDITIYPRVVSGTPRIEVYENNGSVVLAEFTTITSNQYNKIYLTNLSGTQDTFDLKIVGGGIEFDHIIDPSDTERPTNYLNSMPDIVLKRINVTQQGSNVEVNITINVSNGYGGNGLGSWGVNLSFWNTTYNGSFSSIAHSVGAVTTASQDIFLGDMDGDGDLDFVTVDEGLDTIIWENPGTGSMAGWTENLVGTTSNDLLKAIGIADFDNDGDLDIAVSDKGFDTRIFENPGGGDLTGWTNHLVGSKADDVKAIYYGDFNQDGDVDIVIGDDDNIVTIWENPGGGDLNGWTGRVVGTATNKVKSLRAGDMDGDGDLDIVSGDQNLDVRIWENPGGGDLTGWTNNAVGKGDDDIKGMALGDMNGDGDIDIVTGDFGADVIIWESPGGGDLTNWPERAVGTVGNQIKTVDTGDFNGDGNIDIISADDDLNIYLWKNPGGGDLTGWPSELLGAGLRVKFGDMNGDGDLDVASGSTSTAVNIWENTGTNFSMVGSKVTVPITNKNSNETYVSFTWSNPPAGKYNLTAVADISQNLSDVMRSNNRLNITFEVTGVEDNCDPPGSGDWAIDCSDECVWDNPISVPADIYMTSSGTLTLNSQMHFTATNWQIYKEDGCTVVVNSGGSIE